jgi:hypothetical protein
MINRLPFRGPLGFWNHYRPEDLRVLRYCSNYLEVKLRHM